MTVTLFILGLPGSGKSTVSNHIVEYIKRRYKDCAAKHISDYQILYEKFKKDTERKYFKPTRHGGFDIHDFTILDNALEELVQEVKNLIRAAQGEELLIIEFARNDYLQAFKLFDNNFVHNAYFLFLDVDVQICKERIRKRVTHKSTSDDHYVSEDIFKTYYYKDSKEYMASGLKTDYGIDDHRVEIVDNRGSLENIEIKACEFVDFILK